MKIVCFEWKDAFGNGGWFDRAELKAVVEDVELWCHTTGFLVKKTKRELIVCTTWQPANGCHRMQEKFCNLHKIPMTWVRNYRVLGHSKPNNAVRGAAEPRTLDGLVGSSESKGE